MSLARDITAVGSGTLVSRLLAYVRDAGIAALLGAGPFSEALFAVLQVVNFFRRLLAEGALNGSFVPIWLRLAGASDGAANANRFTARVFVVVGYVSGAVALLVVMGAHFVIAAVAPGFDSGRQALATFDLLIVAPYIMLAGLVAVISAALNAEQRVGAVAVSTALFNLVLVLALILVFVEHVEPFYVSVWLVTGIVVAGMIQLLVTGTAWLARGGRWRRARMRAPDETTLFFRRAVPGLIAAGIPQVKLIAATAIVSSAPAAVSWLYYANRLYELPLGIASVAIAAVMVPRVAAGAHVGGAAYAAALSRACEIALGLALPAAAGFALLAAPIAGGLFEHGAFTARDTDAVAAALTAICAGLPGHALEKWLGAISFAHEDTHTPMLSALCGLAAAVGGGLLLFPRYGYVGAAAAIAISGWVGAAVLAGLLGHRGWLRLDGDAARRLPRIVLATIVMGAAVAAAYALSSPLPSAALGRLVMLAVLVTLGLVVYAAALEFLGVAKFKHLIASLRARS